MKKLEKVEFDEIKNEQESEFESLQKGNDKKE
jgi:hypothetical protein